MNEATEQVVGKRTRLRPVRVEDLESLRHWRNESRNLFCDNRVIDPDGQVAWFRAYEHRADDTFYIIELTGGDAIGCIGLSDIDLVAGSAEFGRLIIGDERYRGTGLARDASEALVSYARDVLGLRELHLKVLEGNARAEALYEKLGFRRDGSLDGEFRSVTRSIEWYGMRLLLRSEGMSDVAVSK